MVSPSLVPRLENLAQAAGPPAACYQGLFCSVRPASGLQPLGWGRLLGSGAALGAVLHEGEAAWEGVCFFKNHCDAEQCAV